MKKLLEKISNDSMSVDERIHNILMAYSFILASLATILSAVIQTPVKALIPIALLAVLAFVCLFHSLAIKTTNAVPAIFISIVNFLLLPYIYFISGGIHSGMPIWFLLAIVFSFFFVSRYYRIVVYFISILLFGLCIFTEVVHPEYVTQIPTEQGKITDIAFATLLGTMALAGIYRIEKKLYTEQNAMLAIKEKNLKDACAKLENANAAKSTFLASMSHEIRTPINSILGLDEMILREADDDKTIEYAAGIETASQSLLSLINDVLDFSKIESGKVDLVEADFRTEDLINESIAVVEPRIASKNLEFKVDIQKGLPSVLHGDCGRLRQIIVNLLTNAAKYTTVGSVTLSMSATHSPEPGKKVIIFSVKDTGCGIKPEDKNRLFKNFERIYDGNNKSVEGTGLGLAITKNLVEVMEGIIGVESEYGKGSEFMASIPLGVVDDTPFEFVRKAFTDKVISARNYTESFSAPDAKVLSVDDVKMNQDVLRMLLKRTGMKIDQVYSGRECLKMLEVETYDLILMDHMMPEMDGIETFRHIRNMTDNPNCNVPVVILTANAIAGAKEEYLREGFCGYLSKPVKGEDLEAMLREKLPAGLVHISEKRSDDNKNSMVLSRKVFEEIEGMDVDYALDCCANSVEMLFKAAATFVGHDNRYGRLNQLFADENWSGYEVNIHAVKSGSLMIGLKDLSEHAKALEMALKAGNPEYVRNNHKTVMAEYKECMARIQEVTTKAGIEE